MAIAGAVFLTGAILCDTAFSDDRIVAGSVGGGAVELLWLPEDLSWPAGGWRLERIVDGNPIGVAETSLGSDVDAMSRIGPDASQGIAEFADKLRRGTLSQEERESADTVFSVAAIISVDYGRALGLRYRDTNVPSGPITYRLSALDAQGEVFRSAESDTIDAGLVAPLPHAPENAAVAIDDIGVTVSWADPPDIPTAPIAGYRVVRVEREGVADLTPDLHLRTDQDDPLPLALFDPEAPRDQLFAYDLASVDVFGRASTSKRVLVTLGRLAQAVVPTDLAGIADVESALLSWSAVDHPGVAGLVVEQSLFIGGPYEAITPKGLAANATEFGVQGLRPGTGYFFRIRTFDADGNLGEASLPAKVVPIAAAPPPAPGNLSAAAGPTRVVLTWDEAPIDLAGYFVFRQLEGETEWKQLNGTVTSEPRFVDRFEQGNFSDQVLRYRVQAIGYDSAASPFSEIQSVAFGDTTIPPPPQITAVSGAGGHATIVFRPGQPAADSNRFLILRSDDENAPALVRGEALPAEAREFVDPDVQPGETYWFEVVALDAVDNRSDPSESRAGPPSPRPNCRPQRRQARSSAKSLSHMSPWR